VLYRRELHFLCETLKKCRVQAITVSENDPLAKIMDPDLENIYDMTTANDISIKEFIGKIDYATLYKLSNDFELNYIVLQLPKDNNDNILIIGPYLYTSLTPSKLLELGEKNGITPKGQKAFEIYFNSIPIIPENSHIFSMITTFGELLWGDSYAIIDKEKQSEVMDSIINESISKNFDDMLVTAKAMEKRYSYENEIMQAISYGQLHKGISLLPSIDEKNFEKRVTDRLRNMQNYCIIMNTLFRKAAENGGVHPIYLDSVSSTFATRIEQLTTIKDASSLMREMFRTYCRLVRVQSTKDFSPVVQKTMILINNDISADLTLSSLAAEQNVSPGYLSTIFKKDTGKTLTQYIREKRLNHAVHLLNTTNLQVQTIALHCGIMDVQYFSKIFKKYTGKTPSEYRESLAEK